METGHFITYNRYFKFVVSPAAILTNSYVAGSIIGVDITGTNGQSLHIPVSELNTLALEVAFTLGSLTSANIKVEFSEDNVTYYQVVVGSISGGTNSISQMVFNLTATGNYLININSEAFTGSGFKTKYIRISAQGVGTVTSSSMAITALLGVV